MAMSHRDLLHTFDATELDDTQLMELVTCVPEYDSKIKSHTAAAIRATIRGAIRANNIDFARAVDILKPPPEPVAPAPEPAAEPQEPPQEPDDG